MCRCVVLDSRCTNFYRPHLIVTRNEESEWGSFWSFFVCDASVSNIKSKLPVQQRPFIQDKSCQAMPEWGENPLCCMHGCTKQNTAWDFLFRKGKREFQKITKKNLSLSLTLFQTFFTQLLSTLLLNFPWPPVSPCQSKQWAPASLPSADFYYY